jgi:GDPmannose 4,6-dehydratase
MKLSRTFITGPSGQDGKILISQLASENIEVACLCRTVTESIALRKLFPKLKVYIGDLMNLASIVEALSDFQPSLVFHLGALSSVSQSFLHPQLTQDTNVAGTNNVINAIILSNLKSTKLYNASSSEIFGNHHSLPITEDHPKQPVSPYGKSKLEAHNLVTSFRESGHFAVSGILFNHESPLRKNTFVTRKITQHIAARLLGLNRQLELGDLTVIRDWGWAPDYVHGMRRMLAQDMPEDLILATGCGHSLKEFVEIAFSIYGFQSEINEIQVNKSFFRSDDIQISVGDASKAAHRLDWSPSRSLKETIEEMVKVDSAILKGQVEEGFWLPDFKSEMFDE